MTIRECATCRRWFRDSDGTGVCPQGHEPAEDAPELAPGDIVQITDERPGLVGALLMVEEVKTWGVQGFIHHVASFQESSRIYLRLEHNRFERIGRAVMVPADVVGEGS